MNPAHRAVRPSWTCTVDGLPWPCTEAQQSLSSTDPAVLRQTMAKLMAIAQRELDNTDLATLYRRFLAWTLESEQLCAICGSRRHAVLPGVPPRLIPCDGLRAAFAASDLPD